MTISFSKIISSKSAAIMGIIFLLPILFAFTTAATGFQPFINLTSFNGRATPFGLALFHIGLAGLPLAFLVNLLSMLSAKLMLSKWSVEGKISVAPKSVNIIIAAIGFFIALLFGGHLLIDAIACLQGNISACD